jgi:hypothetical protein
MSTIGTSASPCSPPARTLSTTSVTRLADPAQRGWQFAGENLECFRRRTRRRTAVRVVHLVLR